MARESTQEVSGTYESLEKGITPSTGSFAARKLVEETQLGEKRVINSFLNCGLVDFPRCFVRTIAAVHCGDRGVSVSNFNTALSFTEG